MTSCTGGLVQFLQAHGDCKTAQRGALPGVVKSQDRPWTPNQGSTPSPSAAQQAQRRCQDPAPSPRGGSRTADGSKWAGRYVSFPTSTSDVASPEQKLDMPASAVPFAADTDDPGELLIPERLDAAEAHRVGTNSLKPGTSPASKASCPPATSTTGASARWQGNCPDPTSLDKFLAPSTCIGFIGPSACGAVSPMRRSTGGHARRGSYPSAAHYRTGT